VRAWPSRSRTLSRRPPRTASAGLVSVLGCCWHSARFAFASLIVRSCTSSRNGPSVPSRTDERDVGPAGFSYPIRRLTDSEF
jgi:hypothetical protein